MKDSFGRDIDYMRVSVTDRCNLRCKYCMPHDLPGIPHEEILRYEEILRVCGAAARLGISNIRVTGGEPLVRRGCVDFIRRLKTVPGIRRVTMTTNGVLLGSSLGVLADAGIDGTNISLDTLDPEKYRELTGFDAFSAVWDSILRALEYPFPVKLNCVALKGVNDGEYPAFAALAERYPLDIRFIETMPIGLGKKFEPVTGGEILLRLREIYPDLRESLEKKGRGPARYYKSEKMRGSIGVIDAVSHNFCKSCNRLRLTGEGFLKLCLYHRGGVDLRTILRSGASDGELLAAMESAVLQKPEKHGFDNAQTPEARGMSGIGG